MIYFKRISLSIVVFLFGSMGSAECFRSIDHIFNQGRDYFQRGQYLLSTQQFSLYSQLSCDTEQQENGRLRWAQSLFELGETQEGNLVLDKINAKSPYFLTGKIIQSWYQPSLVSSLAEKEKIRFQDWNQQTHSLPNEKNPWLSGTMSAVVPGLGQAYNGNYQSAFFSFVLNALFLSATLELHNKNMDATALAAGAVFSVVYVGNIVGTVQSSNAINLNAQQDQRSELKFKIFPELSF